MRSIKYIFSLFCIVVLFNAESTAQIKLDFANVEYANVNGISLKLDIYLPKGISKPYPVIVWIHGGAWRGGSKENPNGTFLLQQGYALVSINYRLSQQTIFPAQVHDCKGAIRWIKANANTYGFLADKIGVLGSSAGGHLVALLGTSGNVQTLEGSVGGNSYFTSTVQAVCDWFGPTNFLTIGNYPSSIDRSSPSCPEALLIGGALKSNPDKARTASPVTYITPDDPPFLIMHGTADMTVPFHQSVELDSALKGAHVHSTLIPIIDAGHGGGGFNSDSTRKTIIEFFNTHLRGNTTSILQLHSLNKDIRLEQNYPNPFKPFTHIQYELPSSSVVRVKIFNAVGQEIAMLVNQKQEAGRHSTSWRGEKSPAGVYYYQLEVNGLVFKKKMLHLR